MNQVNTSLRNSKGTVMKRFSLIGMLALLSLSVLGCNQANGTIERIQTNLVQKDIFEGEWWILQSIVDVDGDATATGAFWNGDSGWGDLGIDRGQSTTISRVRWVIDQNHLFAYRAYEIIDGGNEGGRDEGFRGQPLAAFAIEDHVDIRCAYNTQTGECTNVVNENTTDRRWYEREYMRVDWSQNVVQSFTLAANLAALGGFQAESTPFDINDSASHPDFPASWAPQFVRVNEDPDYRFADEWTAEDADTVHYMSFVTISMFSPGQNCLLIGGGTCQTYQIPMRLAFLRVPPSHNYGAAVQTHDEFDRFGLFRTHQSTYVRGGQDVSTLRNHCNMDSVEEDCGMGGACDPVENICYGGRTSDFGETDFLTFYRPRHNFFMSSLTDQTCRQNWECNGRFDDTPGVAGSTCDPAARRCTIPMAEREVRTVNYHLNPGFPVHLMTPAMEVMGNWNEVFMRGWRAARNVALPNYADVAVDCQSDNPVAYCFCGSADMTPGTSTCEGRYDSFVSPDEWRSRGVVEPFDCFIANDDFTEPTNPSSYEEYTLPGAFHYTFRGPECMFILNTNSCDWNRTDADMACDDVVDAEENPIEYEQLGDIRYQFFNYIDQTFTPFGGVAYPLADVTNGELISGNINFSAGSVESVGTLALEWFPVLRCANDDLGCAPGEEGAQERYLDGENIRDYFSRLDNTEHPVGIASSGRDGFSTDDRSRPAIPADLSATLSEITSRALPRIERLHGDEGRFNILSDRMRSLAGTHFETDMMEAMGSNGRDLMQRAFQANGAMTNIDPNARITDQAVLDQVSPFRGNGFVNAMSGERQAQDELSRHNMCTFAESLFRSRYWEFWAEAFRGRPLAEASIRLQQLYTRMVQHHEMGHSVGLRHNFGASFDRNNYGNGFYNVVIGDPADPSDDLALPRMQDFDDPALGGDANGFVGGEEVDLYISTLRTTRNERAARGVSNYMTGSTMDYNGDTSDAQGLGRYDVAATVWSYFDRVEAYVGDPRISSADSLNDMHRASTTERVWWSTYLGGESCDADTDCPSAAGAASLASGQPISQRCVRHPRNTRLPEPCAGDRQCVCSTFDEDFKDYVDGVAYNNDTDGDDEIDNWPVTYLFCTDDRANDISWCNRQDAGESFQEQLDHYRRRFEEGYASTYYRRFRRGGARSGASIGSIIDAAKIYQHLFFRVFFEPGFTSNEGPLGFLDQFLASVDAMNWFIELANLPDQGSYALDDDTGNYSFLGEEMEMAGSDFSLPVGSGYGMWTKYQEGYFGFFRPERAGVFIDKYFALYALAIRDWGLNFTVDERFFINFYDLFPVEMTEFFGGMVIDDPSWFAPRVEMVEGEAQVQNMSWYRGLALGECTPGGRTTPCRDSQPVVYDTPALEGTSNTILRSWAGILALAQFPVFYDTSFEQRLVIYKLGSGTGFDLGTIAGDGGPLCVWGGTPVDPTHVAADAVDGDGCDTAEDADYIVYISERFHTPYLAVKVKPRVDYNLEEEQLGFQLLARLVAMAEQVDALETAGDPGASAARVRLQEQESFLEYLIDLQAQYGISNTLF